MKKYRRYICNDYGLEFRVLYNNFKNIVDDYTPQHCPKCGALEDCLDKISSDERMDATLERAISIAALAHEGQMDKGGSHTYFIH